MLRLAPLVGVAIGLAAALPLVIGTMLHLGSFLAATLSVIVSVWATGALHEDGLADVADGFGGGRDAAHRLEIMRDSRVGSFGVVAVSLDLLLRVGCLAHLAAVVGPLAACAAIVAGAAVSRAAMLMPMTFLPPARRDGLAHATGQFGRANLGTATCLACVVAGLLSLATGVSGLRFGAAILAAAVASLAVGRLARQKIAGVTGDVVGAAQQVSEIAFLLALCAAPPRL